MTLIVNQSNWNELVEQSSLPVLVDFWAEWCGSCVSVVGPLMDALSHEYNDKIRVVKINVDENPEIAKRYNVRNIPSVLFFKDGEVHDKLVGAIPKSHVVKKIESQFQ